MKTLAIMVVLFFLTSSSGLKPQARILISNPDDSKGIITPLLSGCFIEFMQNFINGSYGMWAQELQNRGFDMEDFDWNDNASFHWNVWGQSIKKKNELKLIDGGYNPNGKYFQRIIKAIRDSVFGIYQTVYVYDTLGGDFYVYLRSDSDSMIAKIMLCDTADNEVMFEQSIVGITKNWKKFSLKTNPVAGTHHAKLVIAIEDSGSLDIDEASFMAENNVKGIKNEYYKIFKSWWPGIIRYLGGFFADMEENILSNCIGDIDKRKSPIRQGTYMSQRMDFGLDEFVAFCRDIGAEPHIVVNMIFATPSDAADYIQYCNGDTNTKMGKLRMMNGNINPYAIKFWEVGNEQWANPLKMATDYVRFEKAMRMADSDIQIMICGNLWGGKEYADTLFGIAGAETDLYSYHSVYPARVDTNQFDDVERYKSIIGSSFCPEIEVPMLLSWLEEYGRDKEIKLALTELFLHYGLPFNLFDSLAANSTLETGLWAAGYVNSCFRFCKNLSIVEKSFGIGHIKAGYNSIGDRIIYSTPTQLVLDFMQHHRGDHLVESIIQCDKYFTKDIKGLFTLFDIPVLDVTVSSDNNKVYISVLNRHPEDTVMTDILIPFSTSQLKCEIYELNSEHYSDYSSFDEPERIKFRKRDVCLTDSYGFPPHSYTMIEVPRSIDPIDSDEEDKSNDFRVFPNPAEEYVYLYKKEKITEGEILVVYNQNGEKLLNITPIINSNYIRIDTRNLPKGIYIGMIGNDPAQNFKFIKQ
jgi:alpha-N-arabinofuranosidase